MNLTVKDRRSVGPRLRARRHPEGNSATRGISTCHRSFCALMHHHEPRNLIAPWLIGLLFAAATVHAAPLPQLPPKQLGFNSQHLAHIDRAVAAAIADKQIPGCVICIGRRGGVAWLRAYGNRQIEPAVEPMTVDTVFDMASITKPVATATSVMILVEQGRVRLGDPVAKYLPEFGQNDKQKITVEQLLTHQGGLIPDNPLADYEQGADEAWRRIWALKPQVEPGTKFVYTDVGYLVLAEIVRAVSGQPINEFAEEHIFQPLGMTETGYVPADNLRARTAPTEQRDGAWLRGAVHDPRSALLGGVAGHAGLFSTAQDLAIYCDAMLRAGTSPRARVLGRATFKEMIRPRNIAGHHRALGWDVQSKYSTNRGENYSDQAFGHGGFTGTAMWIDPGLDLFVILLSNRLHPDGKGGANPLAGRVGAIAAAAISDATPAEARRSGKRARPQTHADEQPVRCGIDVLEQQQFAPLTGLRIGLITNHTGLNLAGERTIDLVHGAPKVQLQKIFSPEHGIAGKLDQPNIDDSRDATTGVPILSLYGASRKPEAKELDGLDALVFDIQDIGTRYYTYISTMGLAMEAAGQHGLKFFVLDRPNPIGGVATGGPPLDEGRESFVGFHQMPLRHGMTAGELARMFRAHRKLQVDLQVIRLENWRRRELWDETGLVWTNPSPNMRNLTQALLYPGVGLLETTNLSVGRGTDTPFEVFGAPWINARELAADLNRQAIGGLRFIPIRFTPTASKFANESCEGVNLHVVDRGPLRPGQLGIQLAVTLRRLYPNHWSLERFDRLLINREIFQAVQNGKTAREIEASYNAALKDFRKSRRKFLLYE